jgi:putative DNA primase/helicase
VRPAYEKKANTYARRTVFFGTVDESQFLMDKAGNRRFWTISVDAVTTNHKIDVQQLWAEAYEDWKKDNKYWMDREEIQLLNEHNEQYMVGDPIEELIADRFVKGSAENGQWMNTTEIVSRIIKGKPSKGDINDAARYLNKKGYKRRKKGSGSQGGARRSSEADERRERPGRWSISRRDPRHAAVQRSV